MPRGRKTITKRAPNKQSVITPQRRIRVDWTQSYTSLLMGVVVVIVGILFVMSVIKDHVMHTTQQTSSISTQRDITPTPAPVNTYTVSEGESLWSIADKVYHDSYQWTKIADANNIKDPFNIDPGEKLTLPVITPTPAQNFGQLITPVPTIVESQTQSMTNQTAITGKTYTIQANDNLWDIAVRAYSDGYRWPDIAKANNLTNPELIFSGNVLQIPRP